jgi:hypothetical protein
VLLSCAQFDREVRGERMSDKIAASKRKASGWGGQVPPGYRVPAGGAVEGGIVSRLCGLSPRLPSSGRDPGCNRRALAGWMRGFAPAARFVPSLGRTDALVRTGVARGDEGSSSCGIH